VAEERVFQIQLEGVIQLPARNLHADPDVFAREMIQNAHYSILRRAEIAAERGGDDRRQRLRAHGGGNRRVPVHDRQVRDRAAQRVHRGGAVERADASNPTVRKLSARPDPYDQVSRQAIVALLNNALLLLARTLPVSAVQAMFNQNNQVIELMLTLAEERSRLEAEIFRSQVGLDEPGCG
jgi:HSP90 family molecular chaperone